MTIMLDGTAEQQKQFIDEGLKPIIVQLGLSSVDDWKQRVEFTRQVTDSVYQFGDSLVKSTL